MIGNCATAGTLENDFTRVLDRSQDTLGRSTAFQLKDGTTLENRADYSYTPTDGRLQSISGGGLQPPSPANTFTYNYLPNSHLIEKISGPIHDVNNTWEPTRNVLATKQNKVGTTVVSQYDYTVNAIGQRTNLATSGTAFANAPSWLWGYDSLGQVISADSNVNTSDRTYQYDTIGNRLQSGAGVSPAAITNYTANALNQYSQISNSQILNPSYDDDGNATAYPLPVAPTNNSALAWDGENRLVSTTVNGTTTTYLYDAQSRRICTQSPISNPQSTLYIYDGFNCIAEYSGTTLSKTRLWGIDLSGAPQGAGGVGGLLVEKQGSNLYCPLFDGNGNVSEYLAADGSIPVHFEYDSFGNTVVNTDSGNLFNYRFSTKPLDFTTGLYYYQYRYYDPLTGRWPSRDPIEEEGGVNLYGFVINDGLNRLDILGLATNSGYGYYGGNLFQVMNAPDEKNSIPQKVEWGFFLKVSEEEEEVDVKIPIELHKNDSLHGAVIPKMKAGVGKVWDYKFRISCKTKRSGICNFVIRVSLDFDQIKHHDVIVYSKRDYDRAKVQFNSKKWAGENIGNLTVGNVAAHESGHLLGNPDLYNEVGGSTVSVGYRPIITNHTIVGSSKEDQTIPANQNPTNIMQDYTQSDVNESQYQKIKESAENYLNIKPGDCQLIRLDK